VSVDRKLQELREALSQKRRALVATRARERRVLAELERIERTREALERERERLAARLQRVRAEERRTQERLIAAEVRLRQSRARLARRLRDIYRAGRAGYVDVLLGARTFPEFLNRFRFLSRIVRADTALLDRTRREYGAWRELRAELGARRREMEALAQALAARDRALREHERDKRMLLDRISRERALYERAVEELEEDSRRLEALIRRLQGSAAPTRISLRIRAGLVWPARGPVVSGFGVRLHPLFRIRRMHTGVDIAAPWGSPVRAASPGTVIYTGWFGGYGKIVLVDHGGGVSTLYGHLSAILVSPGQRVPAGALLGRVGSTGYTTGPHLHFEVRFRGRPVDPLRP
ncbi:MAG: peptidoglycan DD-metalloendopeptidase family protein, partial [Armatimonadota bacterium]|nr:peptidoglycan DD-metalloendopeptidase family protein [Armatimonadota bacterium]